MLIFRLEIYENILRTDTEEILRNTENHRAFLCVTL